MQTQTCKRWSNVKNSASLLPTLLGIQMPLLVGVVIEKKATVDNNRFLRISPSTGAPSCRHRCEGWTQPNRRASLAPRASLHYMRAGHRLTGPPAERDLERARQCQGEHRRGSLGS